MIGRGIDRKNCDWKSQPRLVEASMHPLPMILPPTTTRAGRMNPAVRFTEASIHIIARHDTREEDTRNELVAEPRRASLKA